MTNDQTPQGRVARQYMTHKGLGDYEPQGVEKLDDQDCWYYYYWLPEGTLELEVFYDKKDGWKVTVTTFTLAG